MNHRFSWLVAIQGLLFAALAFAWKDAGELVPLCSVLGIGTSISMATGFHFAGKAISTLHNEWIENLPEGYNGPSVIGYMTPSRICRCLNPWAAMPFLFICSWLWASLCWFLQ